MKRFIIATDHAGKKLKPKIEKVLIDLKIPFEDYSPENKETDDYPDFAKEVAQEVSYNKSNYGLLVCGTGIGMSIAANKVKGIRAALIHTKKEAELARKHNNANVLVLPGPYSSTRLKETEVKQIIKTFYKTNFLKGKYQRRVNKIEKPSKT